jgi:hypothetical protein
MTCLVPASRRLSALMALTRMHSKERWVLGRQRSVATCAKLISLSVRRGRHHSPWRLTRWDIGIVSGWRIATVPKSRWCRSLAIRLRNSARQHAGAMALSVTVGTRFAAVAGIFIALG